MSGVKLANIAREVGFSDLKQLSEISGFSVRSIQRWHTENPNRFECVLAGAVALKKKRKAGIVIHKEPEGFGVMESCVFCGTATRYWACCGQNPVCTSCSKIKSEQDLEGLMS